MQSIPVLIVGAGPTGLSMAIELNRYGIPCRIVDKRIKPVETSNALAAQTRTLEVWDDIGLLQRALERGIPLKGANLFSKDKQIAEITFSHLKSSFHFLLGISQHQIEEMLIEYLKEKDIFVEYQTELMNLISSNDSVEVSLKRPDATEEKLKPDWVIGCDGGHSQVREQSGIPFIGKELTQHFMLADLEIKSDLTKNKLNLFTSPKGILAIISFNDKYSRLIIDATHDPELKTAKSLTFAQLKRVVNERCPFDLEMKEPIWTSGFWIHARMAETFQMGRVFLAGDAAHIHSPAGGQGMNTGVQDANNLAWKLAWVMQGKANKVILETYNIERQSVASGILKGTTALTKVMTFKNPILQFLRNSFIAWASRSIKLQTFFTNTLAQLNIHYPSNLLVEDYLGKKPGPKAGTKALDVNEKLFEPIRGPHLSLLCFMGMQDQADVALYYDLMNTLQRKFDLPMHYVLVRIKDEFVDWQGYKIFDQDKSLHELYGAQEPCIYLIRPDKYIGFRGGLSHLKEFEEWLSDAFCCHPERSHPERSEGSIPN